MRENSLFDAIPPEKLIFVNRNLRLSSIKMIGFDMDYTLAIYRYPDFEILALNKTIDRLIQKGYPESIFKREYGQEYVMRGLVIDKVNGNVLKLDKYNFVHRAMHGKRHLSYEERYANYRNKKLDLSSDDFLWMDTLFSLPEVSIIIDAIDNIDRQGLSRSIRYYELINDVRRSIDEIHQDGTLKSIVLQDIQRYIEFDPNLPITLHRFKSNGKKLFLLTNSYWDYTNAVMSYLLNNRLPEYPGWTNYFDIIIVGAGKPEFFNSNNNFFTVNTRTGQIKPLQTTISAFIKGVVYQGGNILDFERLSAIKGENILYIGDHIYGDILSSKKSTLWRTCMIIPELENEIRITKENIGVIKRLNKMEMQRIILERELNKLRYNLKYGMSNGIKRQFEMKKERFNRTLQMVERKKLEMAARYNRYWGSLLKENNELSKFGAQVEDYACVYTSRVSNFMNVSPEEYLVSPPKLLPHELEIDEMAERG